MATKTAKILEIWQVTDWEWQYGKMYSYPLKLDNNETIKLNKKKEDAFKVWMVIMYEVVEEWKKWKQIVEDKKSEFKWKSTYNSEAANRGAMVGMAMKLAFELRYKKEDDFSECALLAQRIFDVAMEIYDGKSEPIAQKEVNEEDLPF